MKHIQLFSMVLLILAGCSKEGYETGNGSYSYVKADFVEAHTVASKEFDRAVTDANEQLVLTPHAFGEWAETADSTYRALLYYNKEKNDGRVVPLQIVRVLTVKYADTTRQDGASRNGLQTIGIRKDSVVVDAAGRRQVYITFIHDQHHVPQYYSSRAYMSLPLQGEDRTSVFHLTIHTYKGVIQRSI